MKKNKDGQEICRIRDTHYISYSNTVKAIITTYPDGKKFSGIAKCDYSKDTYDESFGRKLAFARANDKIYLYNARIYANQIEAAKATYDGRVKEVAKQMVKNEKLRENSEVIYTELAKGEAAKKVTKIETEDC